MIIMKYIACIIALLFLASCSPEPSANQSPQAGNQYIVEHLAEENDDVPYSFFQLEITGKDIDPQEITLLQGTKVTLSILNNADEEVRFYINGYGIEEILEPHAEETVVFTASTQGRFIMGDAGNEERKGLIIVA